MPSLGESCALERSASTIRDECNGVRLLLTRSWERTAAGEPVEDIVSACEEHRRVRWRFVLGYQ